MSIGFITSPACAGHDMGAGHPERPARLDAIHDQLLSSGLDFVLRHFDAPAATREQLVLVHDSDYVDSIFARAPAEGMVVLDEDTSMCPGSLAAALHAAGAVVSAVDRVMAGEVPSAFCAVRPPGHHAERARAMGFCLFNNIAIGAAWARQHYGLERVAIVDFDVHHGNGTEEFVRDRDGFLLCSSFQHPFYPFSGTGELPAHIVNTPLEPGAGGEEFRRAVEEQWLPALEQFQPQMIFISAGFDGHIEDEMAQLRLLEQDYRWVTDVVRELAGRHADGRIVSALEGGYALGALGRSVVAHLNGLIGH
ncbi:Acetoin utilization deacetylase AcuC [Microbulbifer donghaiensis]|uniref:Acetoin utilization deacetylase AcuC n=1 Tax=Microbulbifer donghaiensis TaxID=494016 RepID=A0A1M5E995_9GAMM|nr:histone deacetylase family protein [Microbulbifer donghaiensis]SHF75621.1 Acetoin utilization deacetylase AcuC [Microbulbifer donghaiensis]